MNFITLNASVFLLIMNLHLVDAIDELVIPKKNLQQRVITMVETKASSYERQLKESKKNGSKGILNKALAYIGGKDALMELSKWEITASGESFADFEEIHPRNVIQTSTYDCIYYQDLDNENLRITSFVSPKFENFQLFGDQSFSRIINENLGTLDNRYLFNFAGAMGSSNVAALKRQQMFFNPHILLKMILDNPNIIVSYDASDIHVRITIENEVDDIHLYFEKTNGILQKVETYESHPLIGNIKIVALYEDWDIQAEIGNEYILFPQVITVTGDGRLLWREVRSNVNIEPTFTTDTFDLGVTDVDNFDPVAYQFGLDSHHLVEGFFLLGVPYPATLGMLTPIDIIPDVLYLVPATSNCLILEYNSTGVLLVEAPGTGLVGSSLLEIVKNLAPDKKLTHLLQSHHHVDHAGAVRRILATGVELVVGYGIKSFWNEVISLEDTIRPDGLSESSAGSITEVSENGSIVLIDESPNLVVTVYHTNRDPHANDAMMVGIETVDHLYIYEADMYTGGVNLEIIIDGWEAMVNALIDTNLINDDCTSKKETTTIIPTHGIMKTLEDVFDEIGVVCPEP